MARHLANLGRASYRHRWIVVISWVAAIAAIALAAAALHKPTSDAFNVPGTEAQQALDLLDAKFPGAGGATARLVFAAAGRAEPSDATHVSAPTVSTTTWAPPPVTSVTRFATSSSRWTS